MKILLAKLPNAKGIPGTLSSKENDLPGETLPRGICRWWERSVGKTAASGQKIENWVSDEQEKVKNGAVVRAGGSKSEEDIDAMRRKDSTHVPREQHTRAACGSGRETTSGRRTRKERQKERNENGLNVRNTTSNLEYEEEGRRDANSPRIRRKDEATFLGGREEEWKKAAKSWRDTRKGKSLKKQHEVSGKTDNLQHCVYLSKIDLKEDRRGFSEIAGPCVIGAESAALWRNVDAVAAEDRGGRANTNSNEQQHRVPPRYLADSKIATAFSSTRVSRSSANNNLARHELSWGLLECEKVDDTERERILAKWRNDPRLVGFVNKPVPVDYAHPRASHRKPCQNPVGFAAESGQTLGFDNVPSRANRSPRVSSRTTGSRPIPSPTGPASRSNDPGNGRMCV
ncbi:hypothetical protein WN55_05231 [Dufourea novaeangliae]|uniref:Uncharacterized protein n=1 Tax=Dufourea novaeangliae TaxID=178035 RepID=A0A154PQY1_DUFNO|nr:hypothetical protein WN55_05231 [Dufourea novaeangliae]